MRRVYILTAVDVHSATSIYNLLTKFAQCAVLKCHRITNTATYIRFFKSIVKYMMELSSFSSNLGFEVFCSKHLSRWLYIYGLIASISVRSKLNPNCNKNKNIIFMNSEHTRKHRIHYVNASSLNNNYYFIVITHVITHRHILSRNILQRNQQQCVRRENTH